MKDLKAIRLEGDPDTYKNSYGSPLNFLHPISKINIFVGSNNSGKSRLMRMLAAQQNYAYLSPQIDPEPIRGDFNSSLNNLSSVITQFGYVSVEGISITAINQLKADLAEAIIIPDEYLKLRQLMIEWSNLSDVKMGESPLRMVAEGQPRSRAAEIKENHAERFKTAINQAGSHAIKALDNIFKKPQLQNPKRVYIPSIRGLRPLESTHKDFFEERTRQDYFPGSGPEIFTGLTLYKRLKSMRLGASKERKLLEEYENFLSETLFENKPISLIPFEEEEIVVVEIEDEKDLPIYKLGDGIQSAIILTFLPFIYPDPTFFFIEEPEMYMHPGLQRKLLDFYSHLDQHLFFLTTHSNHFLDLTIDVKDVSIFTVRKIFGESKSKPDFTVEAVDRDCQSSLELLGVRNSSVFLVNATVWVEGITDRLYFREMLNSYIKWQKSQGKPAFALEEDTHYCFVEYGGANITHFSFLDTEDPQIEVERLCSRAILIIDADGNSKLERKEKLEKKLGERLIQLSCREVENLLPYDVIKAVVRDFEKNPDLEFRDRGYSAYKDEYLGTFIERDMFKDNETRKRSYRGDKTGTINSKVPFCKKALPNIKYETLPETTQKVIQKIYQFIVERNS